MHRSLALLLAIAPLMGCVHNTPANCHVESGWLDATNGCSARAGYPDCYRVCADGSRVRVQNLGEASHGPPPGAAPAHGPVPAQGGASAQSGATDPGGALAQGGAAPQGGDAAPPGSAPH